MLREVNEEEVFERWDNEIELTEDFDETYFNLIARCSSSRIRRILSTEDNIIEILH